MAEHAEAFAELVEGRTEAEIRQALAVVEAMLKAMDAAALAELQRVVEHVNGRRAVLAGAA